ncbi:MAG: hypothetical protein H5T92_04260 [Synergistales bacterium]|nr:hypothetical protein [Synergistales bacterium]
MQVKVEKPSMPTIWLDTSVIIKIAKALSDKSRSQDVQDERYLVLYNLVQQKVSQRRILCPEGDQEEEYLLGKRLIRECHAVQTFLSMGIRFAHREQIKRFQLCHHMKAHIEGRTEVIIPYKDFFYGDPVRELAAVKDYVITIQPSASDKEIEARLMSRKTTSERIEAIRQKAVAQGASYEQQLAREYLGELDALIHMLEDWDKRITSGDIPTADDFLRMEPLGFLLAIWDRYKGEPRGLPGLIGFFHSDSYRSVPYVDIACKLWAKIVTSNAKVEPGDSMDIAQLSVAIPCCHFIVTDQKMKNRITDLGLDTKYGTRVFSIRDIDSLQSELGPL